MFVVMRGSAPGHVPVPEGSLVYEEYAPGEGIEVGLLDLIRQKWWDGKEPLR